jgi:predicted nuclease with TOPRIM domain
MADHSAKAGGEVLNGRMFTAPDDIINELKQKLLELQDEKEQWRKDKMRLERRIEDLVSTIRRLQTDFHCN